MFDFEEVKESSIRPVILDGVGYGPAGSVKTMEALVCDGDIVLKRPHAEWPS
jgi:hypothetical protein